MEITPNFQIPCPSPEDYATLSIYMQRLAEQTEAQVLPIHTDLNASLRPNIVVWRNQSVQGPISNAGFTSPGFFLSDLILSTYTVGGLPPQTSAPFAQSGIYHLTWSVTVTPVGAVTANSDRRISVAVFKNSPDGRPVIARGDDIRPETDTAGGNTMLAASIMFVVDEDFNDTEIQTHFSHANAASNMQINIGDAVMSILRVGSIDAIEVV
jgi:hypothetical protein